MVLTWIPQWCIMLFFFSVYFYDIQDLKLVLITTVLLIFIHRCVFPLYYNVSLKMPILLVMYLFTNFQRIKLEITVRT